MKDRSERGGGRERGSGGRGGGGRGGRGGKNKKTSNENIRQQQQPKTNPKDVYEAVEETLEEERFDDRFRVRKNKKLVAHLIFVCALSPKPLLHSAFCTFICIVCQVSFIALKRRYQALEDATYHL